MLKSRHLHKKAVVEIQVNWIFVIIVGGLILIFFIALVTRQKEASEIKIESKITKDLSTIITTAQTSANVFNRISIPRSVINFNCDDNCVCSFKLGDKFTGTSTREKIIFMPSRIEDIELHTWTLDWNIGFRVSNFIYVTSPLIKYYLIYNSSNTYSDKILQYFKKTVPNQMSFIEKNISELTPLIYTENLKHFRIIFLNTSIPSDFFSIFKNQKMSVLQINIVRNIDVKNKIINGDLTFFDYNFQLGTYTQTKLPFVGEASLFGSVFTTNAHDYECMMNNALRRLEYISIIYYNKTKEISTSNVICSYQYGSLLSKLPLKYTSFNSSAQDLIIKGEYIENANSELLENSCPLLY